MNNIKKEWARTSKDHLLMHVQLSLEQFGEFRGVLSSYCQSNKELCFVGSGSTLPIASLCAEMLAYVSNVKLLVKTPYEVLESGLGFDGYILVSARSMHRDAIDVLNRIVELKRPFGVVGLSVLGRAKILLSKHEHLRCYPLDADLDNIEDEFVPIITTVRFVVLVSIAIGVSPSSIKQLFETVFQEHQNNPINFAYGTCLFHVVTPERFRASALNIETRLVEYGIASATISDPWNFWHGRFMTLLERKDSSLIVIDTRIELSKNSAPSHL
jgi:hypothetical protein